MISLLVLTCPDLFVLKKPLTLRNHRKFKAAHQNWSIAGIAEEASDSFRSANSTGSATGLRFLSIRLGHTLDLVLLPEFKLENRTRKHIDDYKGIDQKNKNE